MAVPLSSTQVHVGHCVSHPAFASNFLQMIEMASRNRSDVPTTENANFECLRIVEAFRLGHLCTSLGEVIQSLKNNTIGTKIFANGSIVFAIDYHLFG
jgi:hypothetical protein